MGWRLTAGQEGALRILQPILGNDFYLAGGVAVALRLHHRVSNDLDLFTGSVDPESFEERLAQVPSILIAGRAAGTLHLEVSGVPVSLLRYRYPLLHALETNDRIPILVASIDDLVCMKLSAIGGRGARRDLWDLHEMLVATPMTLISAMALFERKFPAVDRGHVVRALTYFAEAELEPMPLDLDEAKWERIKHDLEVWVLELPPRD